MSDFLDEESGNRYPLWADSSLHIGTVIIKKGVTRIGRHAFDEVGTGSDRDNPYASVKKFIVEDPTLSLPSMNGIRCSVTWRNDLENERAGSAYINYLREDETVPCVTYALSDIDQDGTEELIVHRGETFELVREYYFTYNAYGHVVEFHPAILVDTLSLTFYDRHDLNGFLTRG